MRQIILITHFMEEILLQTIIDKLETTEKRIEILTHTIEGIINHSSDFKEMNEKFRTVQMEVRGIPSRISVPGEEIQYQRLAMVNLTEQLKKPLEQRVKNIHYLNPPFLLSVFLLVVIICLGIWIYFLYPQHSENKTTNNELMVPVTNAAIANSAKPHKLKPKVSTVKKPAQDSLGQAKRKKIDSLYKLLMRNYDQKPAGKQATAADQQTPISQPR